MKSKMMPSIIAMLIVLFAFVAAIGSAAAVPSATRTLPSSVAPGEEFQITISYSDIGMMGQVNETLPDGFTYVSSSLSSGVVTDTNWVKFTLLGGTSFTYNITASDVAGIYTFYGTVKDEDKNVAVVGGNIELVIGASPPTLVTYTITNTTITPPQTTSIDVRFSERVSAIIKIEDASGNLVNELYTSTGVTDPTPKTWDGTYTNGTTVPDGTYTVNVSGVNTTTGLSVVDTSKTIDIPPPNYPPVASFTFSPSYPVTGQIVSFDASGSYDPDGGNITGYWWNISGTVYTVPVFNHTFTTPGLKYCGLMVTDDEGNTNNSAKWVNVNVTTETPTVSIGSAEGSVGDTVNVSINIANATRIGAMDISATYDPGILNATNVASGSMIEDLPAPLVACSLIPGAINISFVTYPDAIDGDGELFVVTFDVVGGDTGESSVLDIEADAYTTDVPPQYVSVGTADGSFVVNSSAVSTVSFDPLNSRTYMGSTTTVNLTLDSVPDGLSGYNLTVSLSNQSIAEIISVSFPTWVTLHDNSTPPADSVWLKAADLVGNVGIGDTNISLGALTIRGDTAGVCDIMVTVTGMDDDDGDPINPGTVSGTINVTSVIPLPDHDNPPTDPDSDGFYEDLNGNGRIDFDDVVQYFRYMEWIAENEPVSCFDFNSNGRIDFDDIAELFGEV